MSTITMELPDEVAALLTTPEGMEWARRAVLEAYEELRDKAQGDNYQLTPEDIEALRQGAADSDAGRFSDAKVNSAERREMILQRQRARAGIQPPAPQHDLPIIF